MIEVRGLYAGYSATPVLKGIDLLCPSGQITAIVGKNGCGKSTLLKTLTNILPIIKGEIKINGIDISSYSRNSIAQTISFLPQSRNVPEITAERMVLHGRFPYLSYPYSYRTEDRRIARDSMERLGIWNLRDMPLSSLSGGMRQKVYIAMALAQGTSVVLMDEPTTFLDISHQYQIMDQARELADEGKTVVMVLHDLSQALRAADDVIVLQQGKVVGNGAPETVFQSGILNQIFGVEIERVKTNHGWLYVYERKLDI